VKRKHCQRTLAVGVVAIAMAAVGGVYAVTSAPGILALRYRGLTISA
jgi:hypothetical protein